MNHFIRAPNLGTTKALRRGFRVRGAPRSKIVPELRIIRTSGDECALDARRFESFRRGLLGSTLLPGDEGYDTARHVWNGMVDKRPALIVQCADTNDVVSCIDLAREQELQFSVRGGGHNYAGKAICEGGLVIDLSLMKGICVDPERQTVRAQAGLRLGEFDRETQKFSLATTLGVNTDTGISWLTLAARGGSN